MNYGRLSKFNRLIDRASASASRLKVA